MSTHKNNSDLDSDCAGRRQPTRRSCTETDMFPLKTLQAEVQLCLLLASSVIFCSYSLFNFVHEFDFKLAMNSGTDKWGTVTVIDGP